MKGLICRLLITYACNKALKYYNITEMLMKQDHYSKYVYCAGSCIKKKYFWLNIANRLQKIALKNG